MSKCGYCTFFSVAYDRNYAQRYSGLLHKELELYLKSFEIKADTVYLGGGTPSLMGAENIRSLLCSLNLGKTQEISLEINPLQINEKFMEDLAQTPVNRLSIGIQSMLDDNLAFLGRRHRSSGMKRVMRLCREYGFDNVSLDLMYGLPGEDCAKLAHDIDLLLELEPEHISAYLLNVEPGTPLAESNPQIPPDEELADQYHLLRKKLNEAGYIQYEISNFARRGYESKHNLHYWHGDNYLGLGASASGLIHNNRYTNPPDLELYERQVDSGNIMPSAEYLDDRQQRTDYIIMALRLREGINRKRYRERFGSDIGDDFRRVFDKPELQSMFELNEDRVRLSESALFVSNRVLEEFV